MVARSWVSFACMMSDLVSETENAQDFFNCINKRTGLEWVSYNQDSPHHKWQSQDFLTYRLQTDRILQCMPGYVWDHRWSNTNSVMMGLGDKDLSSIPTSTEGSFPFTIQGSLSQELGVLQFRTVLALFFWGWSQSWKVKSTVLLPTPTLDISHSCRLKFLTPFFFAWLNC